VVSLSKLGAAEANSAALYFERIIRMLVEGQGLADL
jgi:hypothetical protein